MSGCAAAKTVKSGLERKGEPRAGREALETVVAESRDHRADNFNGGGWAVGGLELKHGLNAEEVLVPGARAAVFVQ